MLYTLKSKSTKKYGVIRIIDTSDQDFCNGYSAELLNNSQPKWDIIWLTDDKEKAEKVANKTEYWYNSCYETPINKNIGDWEVIKLDITDGEKIKMLRDLISVGSNCEDGRGVLLSVADMIINCK